MWGSIGEVAMRYRRYAILGGWGVMCLLRNAESAVPTTAPTGVDNADLSGVAAGLRSENYAEREQAQRVLEGVPVEGLGVLRRLAEAERDPEAKVRLEGVIRRTEGVGAAAGAGGAGGVKGGGGRGGGGGGGGGGGRWRGCWGRRRGYRWMWRRAVMTGTR